MLLCPKNKSKFFCFISECRNIFEFFGFTNFVPKRKMLHSAVDSEKKKFWPYVTGRYL